MESRRLLTSMMLIDNPRTVEGTGGNHVVNFTVSLIAPATVPVSVHYETVDRSARAGSDYLPTSGTLTIAPGQQSVKIPVTIIGDSTPELTENFSMALSAPENAVLLTPQGVGSILNDDAIASTLAINDLSMKRGLDGSKTMLFTVSLSAASTSTVTVTAKTIDITAIAGIDYQATSRVLTFAPGQLTQKLAVTIYGTSTLSADKLFYVNLSGGSVDITRATGAGILKYGA
jgi:hypothetical protein